MTSKILLRRFYDFFVYSFAVRGARPFFMTSTSYHLHLSKRFPIGGDFDFFGRALVDRRVRPSISTVMGSATVNIGPGRRNIVV